MVIRGLSLAILLVAIVSTVSSAQGEKCLTSPGYPNNYPNSAKTKQTMSVPEGQFIDITWKAFQVEFHSKCSYDFVEFKDGNGKVIGKKLCGNGNSLHKYQLPPSFTIRTSTASVLFDSDNSVNKQGFKLCYKPGTVMVGQGYFYIKSELNGMVINIRKGDKNEKNIVTMWPKDGRSRQLWRWEGGSLVSSLNGLALDIKLGNRNKKATLWMYRKNDSPAQKWKLTGGGLLVSQLNGLVLDVKYGNKKKGNTLWMWSKNGKPAQKWKLEPADYVAYAGGQRCSKTSIASSYECGRAAKTLGYSSKVTETNYAKAPPGCLVGHSSDNWKYTYFNKHVWGTIGKSKYRSLCRKVNEGDCFDKNIDYPGNDINLKTASNTDKKDSAAECQTLCSKTNGCEYFTWKPTNECWLKSVMSGKLKQDGSISGPKKCIESDVCDGAWDYTYIYPGSDLRSCSENKKSSAQECQRFCQTIPACVGWEWGSNGNNCCVKSALLNKRFVGWSGQITGKRNSCKPATSWYPCKGENNCCTVEDPCIEDHGDCDNDDECKGDLKCGHNNCNKAKKGFSWDYKDDCCYNPKYAKTQQVRMCSDRVRHPRGGCSAGHGDCNSEVQCKKGLICGNKNCNFKSKSVWAKIIGGDATYDDCCRYKLD